MAQGIRTSHSFLRAAESVHGSKRSSFGEQHNSALVATESTSGISRNPFSLGNRNPFSTDLGFGLSFGQLGTIFVLSSIFLSLIYSVKHASDSEEFLVSVE